MTHEKERCFEMEIDFRQDPETIWRSLTEAEELVRWFPTVAKVEPGKGGSLLLSWDQEDCEFDTRIDIWEPGQRLRLVETKTRMESPTELAMDFQISGRNGGTTLRLVHSGFGRRADWDDELTGVSRGWAYELRVLRHYLNHHAGQDRHMVMLFQPTQKSGRAAFEQVFGPRGLAFEGGVFALPEGEAYRLAADSDEVYEGRVMVNNPPLDWAGVVTGSAPGILRYHLEGDSAVLALSAWGGDGDGVSRFEKKWRKKLAEIL